MTRSTSPEDHLPLHPRVLLVLTALLGEPLHGALLLDRVEELSGGTLRPGPATLYRTLDRLVSDGLLEELVSEADGTPGRPGTPYRLTALGRRVLDAELARLTALGRIVAEARGRGAG